MSLRVYRAFYLNQPKLNIPFPGHSLPWHRTPLNQLPEGWANLPLIRSKYPHSNGREGAPQSETYNYDSDEDILFAPNG